MARFSFDRQKAIATAWDLCWADNLKQRAEGHDFRGNTYHLTASDIENQVRSFAQDTADGKPWTDKRAWGRGYGWSIRLSGDLLSDIRRWLSNNPKLVSHNFGKGHISGKRYRPVGEPLSEAEQGTLKDKAERASRPRLVHKNAQGKPYLCAPVRKRVSWGRSRSQAHITITTERVTCPRCLKLMKETVS